jgi:cobalt-zinc-cadmium efflux system outer membrane protein
MKWPCSCLILLTAATAAAAEPPETLTLEAALARARTSSPALLDARAAVEEAMGLMAESRRLLPDNPTFDAARGHRRDSRIRDVSVGLSQPIEIAGQRGLRVGAARAGLEAARARLEATTRGVLEDVATAFLRTLFAQKRLGLAATAESVAHGLQETAERRYRAGDIAALELNLARMAAGRARAERMAAQAARVLARNELRAVLGMRAEEPLEPVGDLAPPTPVTLTEDAPAQRPAVRARAAELVEAEKAVALARRLRWPELAFEARYERDDGTRVLWGGLRVSLPVVRRHQEELAARAARRERAQRALERAASAAQADGTALREAHALHREAADVLDDSVLPAVEDNDRLSRRAYEAGEIGLAELLLARREGGEARLAHLQAQLDAAVAAVELQARTGGLP